MTKPNDEINLIRSSFKNIRRTNEALQNTVLLNEIFLREKFLKDLLFGITIEGELKKLIIKYDLSYLMKDISVSVIEYTGMENLRGFAGKNDIVSAKKDVFDSFRNDLEFYKGFEIFEISDYQFVVITAGYNLDEIKKYLSKIIDIAEACYNIKLICATGVLYDDLTEIQSSFYDALNILGHKALFNSKNVVTMHNWQELNSYYYPFELEKNLIAYVQRGEKEKTFDMINNIVRKNADLYVDGNAISELKFAMYATIKRITKLFGQAFVFPCEDFENWQKTSEVSWEEFLEGVKYYFGILADETTHGKKSLQN